MSRALRGRTVGRDNIAVALASGTERIILGAAAPSEKVGGKDNVAVGEAFPTAIIADNLASGVTTAVAERLG